MALIDQLLEDKFAIYNGDCIQVMKDLKSSSIGLSVYSPPFGGLYQYSSSDEDISNCLDYDQFFKHYDFVVEEILRLTQPGRMTAVHCMEVPKKSDRGLIDFPGDIIRQHQRMGWDYWARYAIWKEPLRVAIRTRSKGLTHRQIVKDSSLCNNASADYLLVFRKPGENKEPIAHPTGLKKYCGEREIPSDLMKFKNWTDPQTNKMAHVLPYREARENEEEKHCHPLQLDVIERCILLWSNPNDIVFTPFMGVGSEVYGALINDRRGIGIELKSSYYRQAIKNIKQAINLNNQEETFALFEQEELDLEVEEV
jgi:DNA modification methylase